MAEEASSPPADGPPPAAAASAAPRRRGAGSSGTGVNGPVFLCEEVLDKLKILDYETNFLEEKDMTPFPRTYFALPGGSQQFGDFLELVIWLMQQAQRDFATDKYDNPNTSVNKLMLELKTMGFAMDFPASRARQAHGEAVCRILNFLCDQALASRAFQWAAPVYPDEDFAEEAEVDEDAEVGNDIEEEDAEIEEEEVLYSEIVNQETKEQLNDESRQVLEATVDPMAWKTELERVAPRLKVAPTMSGKEWRAHLEQTQQHEKIIGGVFPETQAALDKIGNEVGNMLERVVAKEKYLNNQFDRFSEEYKSEKEKLSTAQEVHQASTQRVTKLTQEYSSISDMLEEVKNSMSDRGASMTDTSPLVKIKQGLAKLKVEIKTMDLRIGVVGHTLMQAKIKHKSSGGGSLRPEDNDDFDLDDDSDTF